MGATKGQNFFLFNKRAKNEVDEDAILLGNLLFNTKNDDHCIR